jgi:hypothetical protein
MTGLSWLMMRWFTAKPDVESDALKVLSNSYKEK